MIYFVAAKDAVAVLSSDIGASTSVVISADTGGKRRVGCGVKQGDSQSLCARNNAYTANLITGANAADIVNVEEFRRGKANEFVEIRRTRLSARGKIVATNIGEFNSLFAVQGNISVSSG